MLLAFFASTLISFSAFPTTTLSFPSKVSIDGKQLILNGTGIRKATWFKVKVYDGALYLSRKSSSPSEVMQMEKPVRIYMRFLRDVSQSEFQGGWEDAFRQSVSKENQTKMAKTFEKFNAFMTKIKKTEDVIITFRQDGVAVNLNNQTKEKFGDSQFSQAILSLWFVKPVDPELMRSLLNIKE